MEAKQSVYKQIITFLAITSVLTTGIFIWMFAGARNSMVAVLLMMWMPGIAALLTSLLWRDSIGSYGWKPGKVRFLGYAFALPVVVSVIAYGLVWTVGITEFYTDEVVNYKWARMLGFDTPTSFPIGLLSKLTLASLVTLIGALGEEIGWSGFLTPKLLKISSVPMTSLIVGGCWAIWHYPAIIGGIYGYGTPLWIALPGFTLALIGASFFRSVLVSKSGSLWNGVIIHLSHNIVLMGMFYDMTVKTKYSGYFVSETGIFLAIVYLIAGVLFWRIQREKSLP